ncbi:MAG TPA: hypothetical protein VF927_10465 [Solirubrobacteraceae bacterium]
MKIELLYVDDCPGHIELREQLPRLLEAAGVEAKIEERRIDSDCAAHEERFLGSPTVRIDGRDVEPGAESREDYGLCCRLYAIGLNRLVWRRLAPAAARHGRRSASGA